VFGTRRTDQLDVNFDLYVNFDLKDQVLSQRWAVRNGRCGAGEL